MPWRDVVTDDTGTMLKSLVEKKEKKEKMTLRHTQSVILMLGLVSYLIYRIFVLQQEQNPFAIMSSNSILFIAIGTVFVLQNYYYLKKKKAKDKFDNLREEVIDHLNYTWYINMQPEIKDQISSYMQDNHNINVVYKTK